MYLTILFVVACKSIIATAVKTRHNHDSSCALFLFSNNLSPHYASGYENNFSVEHANKIHNTLVYV